MYEDFKSTEEALIKDLEDEIMDRDMEIDQLKQALGQESAAKKKWMNKANKYRKQANKLYTPFWNLVKKLEQLNSDPEYLSVFALAQIHRGPYRGMKYESELETAKRNLGIK